MPWTHHITKRTVSRSGRRSWVTRTLSNWSETDRWPLGAQGQLRSWPVGCDRSLFFSASRAAPAPLIGRPQVKSGSDRANWCLTRCLIAGPTGSVEFVLRRRALRRWYRPTWTIRQRQHKPCLRPGPWWYQGGQVHKQSRRPSERRLMALFTAAIALEAEPDHLRHDEEIDNDRQNVLNDRGDRPGPECRVESDARQGPRKQEPDTARQDACHGQ